MNKWRKLTPTLEFICGLKKEQRKQFIFSAKSNVIKNLVDVIYNFLTPKNFPVPQEVVKNLKHLETNLKLICQKKNFHFDQKTTFSKR